MHFTYILIASFLPFLGGHMPPVPPVSYAYDLVLVASHYKASKLTAASA